MTDQVTDREPGPLARPTLLPGLRRVWRSRHCLQLGLDPARAIIVAIPQTIEAGQVIAHARTLQPGIAVVARAHTDRDVDYLLAHGADAAIMGEREIARGMVESIESLDTKLGRYATG